MFHIFFFSKCLNENSTLPCFFSCLLVFEQQIGPGSVQLDVSVNETTKLETITLGLFVHLQREHFTRGKAKVSDEGLL